MPGWGARAIGDDRTPPAGSLVVDAVESTQERLRAG